MQRDTYDTHQPMGRKIRCPKIVRTLIFWLVVASVVVVVVVVAFLHVSWLVGWLDGWMLDVGLMS